ncbi:MAG: N-acetylmuramoyl-L-alanine amidase [Methylacidiphilales bacterium]|nr:N-acetylmuramoyl-L-alanine amidase [Candidatus Methylacidiphilales bacterium]
MPILAGAALGLSIASQGEPTQPNLSQPAGPSLAANLSPVSYPPVTPWSAWSARNINELRHLKTATGSPRLPSPNEWSTLDLYQGTITRQQFEDKLHTLYDPFSGFTPYLDIKDTQVTIYPSPTERRVPQFVLQFAPPNQALAPMRWFRTPEEVRAESHPTDKPLNGLRVAIDPGHIGGPWAQMEERSTRYHGSAPVQEGDLNLITARILKQELVNMGATVFVVRDSTEPVTPYRPEDMLPEARELLMAHSIHESNLRALPADKLNLLFGHKLMDLAEFLFYRCSEIKERGNRIRNNFVPDITVTLYIDATPGSGRGRLTSANANIFFVHGCYTRSEMADPDMRRRCIYKMVEGSSDIEAEVANDISQVFAQRTGLGPVKYGDSSTTRGVIPNNPYVVARNLAANREYDGPVVCTEPYFMNNRVVYQRLLAGDYDGQRTFDGKSYGSIFREYADCVAEGLAKAYASSTVIAGASNPAPQGKTK